MPEKSLEIRVTKQSHRQYKQIRYSALARSASADYNNPNQGDNFK